MRRGPRSTDHAIVIGQTLDALSTDVPLADAEHAEAHLVAHAGMLSFDELRILANRVVEVVDPDSADAILGKKLAAEEKRAMEQAVFQLHKGLDGVATFRGKLPNLHADMLLTSLEALGSPRRDHLRGREGDTPVVGSCVISVLRRQGWVPAVRVPPPPRPPLR